MTRRAMVQRKDLGSRISCALSPVRTRIKVSCARSSASFADPSLNWSQFFSQRWCELYSASNARAGDTAALVDIESYITRPEIHNWMIIDNSYHYNLEHVLFAALSEAIRKWEVYAFRVGNRL